MGLGPWRQEPSKLTIYLLRGPLTDPLMTRVHCTVDDGWMGSTFWVLTPFLQLCQTIRLLRSPQGPRTTLLTKGTSPSSVLWPNITWLQTSPGDPLFLFFMLLCWSLSLRSPFTISLLKQRFPIWHSVPAQDDGNHHLGKNEIKQLGVYILDS